MKFPRLSRAFRRDPFDPAQWIDREIGERGRRLIIGLCIESDFRTASGALLVVEGNGKYLRPIQSITCSTELPPVTVGVLEQLTKAKDLSLLDLEAVQHDIASIQAKMVDELKRHAGKYVERLLIVAVLEPDIGGLAGGTRSELLYVCNSDLLAEATGISVVDSFSTRDITAGGTGDGLIALPAWLMFADRSPRLASRGRLVILIGNEAQALLIPASDGLDVELPEIGWVSVPGLNRLQFLREHLLRDQRTSFEAQIARLSLDGKYIDGLAEYPLGETNFETGFVDNKKPAIQDVVRSTLVSIVEDLSKEVRKDLHGLQLREIVVDSHPDLLGAFVNEVQRKWPNATILNELPGYGAKNSGCMNAILAAVLGAMSIDQMPANLPWITGAGGQRILGRLTPGSPSSWRQLLREMADFQPPAMRLRDAV